MFARRRSATAALIFGAALVASAFTVNVHAQTSTYKVGDVVPSTLAFTDSQGKAHTLTEYRGKPVVLEWTNYGCPFVHKHYDSGNMQKLQGTYTAKGVHWLSVISSAEGKQGHLTQKDAPAAIAKMGSKASAVVLDDKGTLGQAFGAKSTPTIVILDATGKQVYSGAIDSIPSFSKADIPQATNYAAAALDEVLAGKPVSTPVTEAYGCSVKY